MTEVSTRLEEKFRALNSAIKLYRWAAETTTKDPNNSKTKFWNYLSLPPIWYISPVFQFCGWSSWTRGTEWSSWTSRLSFTFKSNYRYGLSFHPVSCPYSCLFQDHAGFLVHLGLAMEKVKRKRCPQKWISINCWFWYVLLYPSFRAGWGCAARARHLCGAGPAKGEGNPSEWNSLISNWLNL